MLLYGRGRPALHFLLKVCFPCATIMPHGDYRDEIEISSVVPDATPSLAPGAIDARKRQAFRRRILFTGQVGTRGRISAALQEEPLPAAEEAGGNGPHDQGLDGPAALPLN